MIGKHALFDIAAWFSALFTTWLLYRWRFQGHVDHLSNRLGFGYFAALSIGGLAGAFAFGTLNVYVSGQAGLGRSIVGGLIGAIALVELYKMRNGIRGSTGAILAVPFAVALTIGRVGCFQAGLEDFTYGVPSDLPWAVDFGDGVGRHPVQLYESLTMATLALAMILSFWRGHHWTLANGFYLVVGVYAAQRFLWEFMKPYATIVGPLNIFHILCLLLFAYALGMVYFGSHERT